VAAISLRSLLGAGQEAAPTELGAFAAGMVVEL
jgi:hypothetical protein